MLQALAMPLAFLAAILLANAALAQPLVQPVPTAAMQPGYGVVQSITPVRVATASAAAGGSAPAGQIRPAYRVAVRMPDGSVQYRDIDRAEFRPGEHVLLTNAGDVVADDFGGGSTPPGESRSGAAPADGAITGGSLAPGETGGTPKHDPTVDEGRSAAAGGSAKARERCYELQGTLREQCLSDETLKRKSAAPRAPTSAAPAPPRE